MKTEILLERDLLYPTDNYSEPGSVHVRIYNPNSNARIPAVIESRSGHSPLKYIDSIIRIMQIDIFDRALIDLRKNVNLYIKTEAELAVEYGGKKFVFVSYEGDSLTCKGVDEVM